MNLKTKSSVFLIGCVLLVSNLNAQSYNSGLSVKMNGYIISIGGQILFQPCEDSARSVWQSLDNTSFALFDFREDLYLEAVENIGDSVKIYCYDINEKKQFYMNFSYFYCSLQVDMMFLDSARFSIYKKPKYQITYNDTIYHVYGFYVDNRIKKIIPKERKNLLLMYRFYADKNYVVPEWLAELIKEQK